MDSLPEIPSETIGSFDFLDLRVLRLISRQARSAFTPCATRIRIVPTNACDRFLSSMARPFESKTIVRLSDASECMSILAKHPGLFCNVKRVICTDTADPNALWLPQFIDLFPNVDSFEIRNENDDACLVVSDSFSKFSQDLKIESVSMRINVPVLTTKNLELGADFIDFDPAVCIAANSVRITGARIHRLPGTLRVPLDFCLDHCLVTWHPIDTATAVLGPAFRSARNLSLLGGDALYLAHECTSNSTHMAARTLVLELNDRDASLLPKFFAEGPRMVERLMLKGVTMDRMPCLYGIPCLRDLDLTPGLSVALRAPPAGLCKMTVRVCSSFFGRDLDMMITYVSVLRAMCKSQGTERLVVLLYGVAAQGLIQGDSESIMTLHDGPP
jgi:hypothetical protein